MQIRPARVDDLAVLPDVETRADAVFAAMGIGPLPPAAEVAELTASAAVLVAGRPPVGFARMEVVDGGAHLEQLAVLPEHTRRGIGGALVEAACAWAAAAGYAAVTLCTFRDVAWNAPFYARHGFDALPDAAVTPGVAALRAHERAAGLDALGPRVVMRRVVAGPGR